MGRVLCVDDERPILSSLRRLFRRAGYEVLLANSGREALDLLETTSVDALISDMRMPQMSGAELLEQVAARWPNIQRMLLTGQADMNATIAAINEGRIFRYLSKPWDDQELLDTVAAAIAERQRREQAAEAQAQNEALLQDNAKLEQNVRDTAHQLVRARSYDSVTQLPNRSLLLQKLQQNIKRSGEEGGEMAVLVVGLDRFQRVNDSLGYEAGDELLRIISQRIALSMFSADTVAHLGGDTFCVVAPRLLAPDEAALLATLLLQQVSIPLYHQGQELYFTASIGIGYYPNDGEDAETLLRNAESALSQAKRSGKNAYRFYHAEMNHLSANELALEAELRQALERGEFRLFYQPRVDTRCGRIIAAEALIRWEHPERGLVPPGEFIPLLEESGLIATVGEWVINEACAMIARLRDAGHSDVFIAINLSARQFASNKLWDQIERACDSNGIALSDGALELEITENLLMQDSSHTERTLRAFSEAGLCIAIDDFGTGYSSLSYLARFPITCVKIDRSFVSNVENDRASRAIIAAMRSLTETLQMQLICEGVETEAQLAVLHEMGCDEFQGFLFSRPLPEAEFLSLLADGSSLPALNTGNKP